MSQPRRRPEIIEIADLSESSDSGGEFLFSRNSQPPASAQTNTSSLFREHIAPVSITATQYTTYPQSVDRAAGSNSPPHGLSPVTASSRSGTRSKGKGKAKEATSTTTPQACESSSSQRNANCLPPASESRPGNLCTFASLRGRRSAYDIYIELALVLLSTSGDLSHNRQEHLQHNPCVTPAYPPSARLTTVL